MADQVRQAAVQEGLVYGFVNGVMVNTFDFCRLLHLA